MRILTAKEIKKAEALSFEKYFTEAELMKGQAMRALQNH